MKHYYFALILLLASCGNQYPEETEKLYSWLRDRDIETHESNAYVFIPLHSCHHCVDATLEFIEGYPDRADLQIIASAFKESTIEERLGKKASWPNVYQDLMNEAYRQGVVGNSVQIFLVEDGQVEQILTPRPDQIGEALKRLEEWL